MPTEMVPDDIFEDFAETEIGENDYEDLKEEKGDYIEDEKSENLIRTTSIERELADAIVRIAPMEELQILMDIGVNVNAKLRHGLTLLHYAVWQDYVDAARLLIDAGINYHKRI